MKHSSWIFLMLAMWCSTTLQAQDKGISFHDNKSWKF